MRFLTRFVAGYLRAWHAIESDGFGIWGLPWGQWQEMAFHSAQLHKASQVSLLPPYVYLHHIRLPQAMAPSLSLMVILDKFLLLSLETWYRYRWLEQSVASKRERRSMIIPCFFSLVLASISFRCSSLYLYVHIYILEAPRICIRGTSPKFSGPCSFGKNEKKSMEKKSKLVFCYFYSIIP